MAEREMDEAWALLVGEGEDRRRIAYRVRGGRAPAIVWLGGYRSDMRGTKAEHLLNHAAETGTGLFLDERLALDLCLVAGLVVTGGGETTGAAECDRRRRGEGEGVSTRKISEGEAYEGLGDGTDGETARVGGRVVGCVADTLGDAGAGGFFVLALGLESLSRAGGNGFATTFFFTLCRGHGWERSR